MKVTLIDSLHAAFVDALKINGGFEMDDRSDIAPEAVVSILPNTEVLVVRSKIFIDKNVLDAAPALKAIARAGAGMDNIDEKECIKRGIALFNAPEGNRRAVAEHVLGMLLALFNKTVPSHQFIAQKNEWNREAGRGEELFGKTIGLIGCGHNGSETGKLLVNLGCKVMAYDKYLAADQYPEGVKPATLQEISEQAEVVSLHVPLTEETQGWIDGEFLNKFHRPIWLVNACRGGVLNWDSIPSLLDLGKIRGIALDVFPTEPPFQNGVFNALKDRPNVLFSPHVAGWTVQSYQKISEVLASKLIHFQKNGA